MSSFSGIQRALTGLQAQRQAMEVTGQNIANINTPGYTRQRVELANLEAKGTVTVDGTPRTVGDGVSVTGTARLADGFLDQKVHRQTSSNADLGTRAETLSSVERLLSEPGETGLSNKLGEMWKSWSTLSTNPENAGAREVVLGRARDVVEALHAGSSAVDLQWDQGRDQLGTNVDEVNQLTTNIAELNDTIRKTVVSGGIANDLSDQRDRLVVRVVELTGATAQQGPGGVTNLYLGGNPLVNESTRSTLRPTTSPTNATNLAEVKAGTARTGLELVTAHGSIAAATITSGEIGARLDGLNTTLPDASKDFDRVAVALAGTVNTQHRLGTATGALTADGRDFFSSTAGPVTAATLQVAITDITQIAAGKPGGGVNDGSNALALNGLRAGANGPDATWKAVTVKIGTATLAAKTSATTVAGALRSAVADQQAAVGVSLDEETANLLVMQRAYEGAARVMTAVDQALDTLINRTGLVGR